MTALRFIWLAALLAVTVLAGTAQAQSIKAAPNPFDQPPAPGGFGGFSQPAPQQQQQPPCMKDFIPLRDAVEKRSLALRAASERKASPQEACKLFISLVASQDKLRKFLHENSSACGIPPPIIKQADDGWKQTDAVRVRVCNVAARPQAPAGPSLSDALGTNRSVEPTSRSGTGGGTFDTLTGTPLGKR